MILGDTIADGRNGSEINGSNNYQSEFTDDDITAKKVTPILEYA